MNRYLFHFKVLFVAIAFYSCQNKELNPENEKEVEEKCLLTKVETINTSDLGGAQHYTSVTGYEYDSLLNIVRNFDEKGQTIFNYINEYDYHKRLETQYTMFHSMLQYTTEFEYYYNGVVKLKRVSGLNGSSVTLHYYNSTGDIEKMYFTANVGKDILKEYEYNSKRQLLTYDEYFGGKLFKTENHVYNQNGQKIQFEKNDVDWGIKILYEYKYDEKERLISESITTTKSSGSRRSEFFYTYNEKDERISFVNNSDGNFFKEGVMTYDMNGDLLTVHESSYKKLFYLINKYEYHPNRQLRSKKTYYTQFGNRTIQPDLLDNEFTYDEKSNLIKEVHYSKNGEKTFERNSTYNCFI